ncbi:MAG: hypothetical protein WC804_20845 [Sphingomonas sp.]|jgi:hypothetical protein|uniref:hypothetical protein n=1 Tax=Sphingomonas sp. TaxID=28214 RepID=UPI0035665D09
MDVAMKSNSLAVVSAQVPNEPFAPRLIADTLETRLTQAIAASRALPGEPASQDEAFRRACRRDAIAAIELGRAIGLLRQTTPGITLCRAASEMVASE